jgi:quercetin dioxygenase-like cupin family protein
MAKGKVRVKKRKEIWARTRANKTTAKSKTPKRDSGVKIEAKHFSWDAVELEELNPLLRRQMVVGKDVMVARIALKQGCSVPLHHHHNEQVSCILEGALKFWIDGKEIVVRGGEVLTIPPHMPHSAEAVADTVALDVFCPPRMDWINKTDEYLRGGK